MTNTKATPEKLYLLQLSATTVPIGPNRTLEMSLGCYLVQTTGDFRQTPGRGGGPMSRCQTRPSSN